MYKCQEIRMNETPKKRQMKRLIADIPPEIHQEIKIQAINKNMSMRQYIVQALVASIRKDRGYE